MKRDPIYLAEQEHLLRTQEKYTEIAAENQEYFDALPGLYPNESEIVMLNELLTATYNRIIRLKQGRDKPYFARIDFAGDDGPAEQYYIGKIGVLDDRDRIVTLDWRAPIATLYYDSNVGRVSYRSPGGAVEGSLELKRQLDIEQGKLESYRDVDTVANDELLQPYLGVNADNRLKNIIATIQSEQNRIIREDIGRNVIVQGVAGSGKTTVALHRIAYLVYNHRDTIKPGQYMVIGPNQFFISYISSVLPDLDVDSVPQYTYAELAREILREDYQVADPAEGLSAVLTGKSDGSDAGYKVSMAYRDALDRFLDTYEQSLCPDTPFAVKGFEILDRETIRTAWKSALGGPGRTTRARVEQCILYLSHQIEGRALALEAKLSDYFREQYRRPEANLDRLNKDRALIERELAKGCATSLKTFFGKAEGKILPVYRLFIQSCGQFAGPDAPDIAALQKRTMAGLRKKRVAPEDLPALLYLKLRLHGARRFRDYRHAVVDEAQDFGAFDFYVLQETLSRCTFTIVGDLAQSIYHYRGIGSWDTVVREAFGGRAGQAELLKSYRNTVEIMGEANRVTDLLGLSPAVPVIRHGVPVRYHKVAARGRGEALVRIIGEHLEDGLQTVALICKTPGEAEQVFEMVRGRVSGAALVTADSTEYGGGICVIPGFLAKGLEFDGVILCDASAAVYDAGKAIDLHLLYVAMTRPLHRMDILHTGMLAPPLQR